MGILTTNTWLSWACFVVAALLLSHISSADDEIDAPDLSLCPNEPACDCFNSGNTSVIAHCSGPSVTTVPSTLPLNLTELIMTRTSLSHLRAGNLSLYGELSVLRLFDNALNQIDNGAFNGIVLLEELYLDRNNLTDLPNGLFSGTPDLRIFSAHSNKLERIPDVKNLEKMFSLVLYDNMIRSVPDQSFENCENLNTLLLYINQISTIENDAFQGLDSLLTLDLQQNQIDEINSRKLRGMPSLQRLVLEDNKITSLGAGSFHDVAETLTSLDISKNLISDINNNAFSGLSSLDFLDLDYNRLTTVPSDALEDLGVLDHLDLSGNLFSNIEAHAFSTLSRLDHLFMRDMPTLLTLDNQAFTGLSDLKSLNLGNNPNLTEFNPEHLPDEDFKLLASIFLYRCGLRVVKEAVFLGKESLVVVQIQENPFHCDCGMDWVPRAVEEEDWAKSWITQGICPTCGSPPHLIPHSMCDMLEMDLTCNDVDIESHIPEPLVAYLHGNSTFLVTLHNGRPTSSWRAPDGEEFSPGPIVPEDKRRQAFQELDEKTHAVHAKFEIDNTTAQDAGEYVLTASNVQGSQQMTFTLEVLPYELTQPPPTASAAHGVPLGDMTIFSCILTLLIKFLYC